MKILQLGYVTTVRLHGHSYTNFANISKTFPSFISTFILSDLEIWSFLSLGSVFFIIGYRAYRNTKLGSWFVRALIYAFMEKGHDGDMSDISNQVSLGHISICST